MNIFVLHPNPKKAARWHADKHVVKMLLESVQMLYSAHWVAKYTFLLDQKSAIGISRVQKQLAIPPLLHTAPSQIKDPTNKGYRPVHLHHPCTKWVRESLQNYFWLCQLALALSLEFRHRWGHSHSCEEHALWLANNPPFIPDIPLTPFAVAMDDQYKTGDPITSYRKFYKTSKTERGITKSYTNRNKPHWL